MKIFLLSLTCFLFSFYCNGQRKESNYKLWSVEFALLQGEKDSLLVDSLFNYYSNFRRDTNGKLGLRITYYKVAGIPFEGLSKQRILQFLGNPDDTLTVKYKEDSIQKTILEYYMGTVIHSKESNMIEGTNYKLLIYIIKGIGVEEFSSYEADPWVSTIDHF